MEIFVDFGLFELLAVFAVASVSRDARARRKLRTAIFTVRAKLGRCVRCMVVTMLGLVICSIAVFALGSHASRLVRWPVYSAELTFAAMGTLHLGAMLYRAMTRLEENVSRAAGGCNCGRRAQSRSQRRLEG